MAQRSSELFTADSHLRGGPLKYIFYDLETTSFRPCGILQICMMSIEVNEATMEVGNPDALISFINPGPDFEISRNVPHNITLDDVRDAPTFEDIRERLTEFIEGGTLIGYNNLRFDDEVLNDWLEGSLAIHIAASIDIYVALEARMTQDRALQEYSLFNPNSHDAGSDAESMILLASRMEGLLSEQVLLAARVLATTFDADVYSPPARIADYPESPLDGGRVQFGGHVDRTMAELRELDEHLWRQLGGTDD